MLKITVAFPLSAGKMVRPISLQTSFKALVSALVRLSVGFKKSLTTFTVSNLISSAVSGGNDLTAFSTPIRIVVMSQHNSDPCVTPMILYHPKVYY